jgi:hypothetical protein
MAEPLSPTTMKHLETVHESSHGPKTSFPMAGAFASRLPAWFGGHRNTTPDVEKNLPTTARQTTFQRLTSPFRPVTAGGETVPMNNTMRTQDVTVQSTAAADRV